MPSLLISAPYTRRELLRQLFFTAGAATVGPLLSACDNSVVPEAGGSPPRNGASRFADIGPLQAPDANGIRLPAGFSSRIVAVSDEIVPGTGYLWHKFPDGGACYAADDGGWVYTSNSEVFGAPLGGVGALRFDAAGNIVSAYPILMGSDSNCAGGKTPWGTWLSCEEFPEGVVWETFPFGTAADAVSYPALGRFSHEAAVVDPVLRVLYLTEDIGDGRFYRFVPSATDWPAGAERPALQDGALQVLRYAELAANKYPPSETFDVGLVHPVVWEDVVSPELPQAAVRNALAAAGQTVPGTVFKGGEGLWYFQGIVYFSTKGDDRIWALDTAAQTLETIYDFATSENPILSGVDNLTISSAGDVLVAEDGGDMELVVILPDRRLLPLMQASDLTGESEITGPAFSPDGTRLYFSAQRNGRNGALGSGITYEILLPFAA